MARARRRCLLLLCLLGGAIVAQTGGPGTVARAVTGDNVSKTFTSPGSFLWTVPSGITSVDVQIAGGAGGGVNGGDGESLQGTLQVTPGHVLTVVVGGQGCPGNPQGGTCLAGQG